MSDAIGDAANHGPSFLADCKSSGSDYSCSSGGSQRMPSNSTAGFFSRLFRFRRSARKYTHKPFEGEARAGDQSKVSGHSSCCSQHLPLILTGRHSPPPSHGTCGSAHTPKDNDGFPIIFPCHFTSLSPLEVIAFQRSANVPRRKHPVVGPPGQAFKWSLFLP